MTRALAERWMMSPDPYISVDTDQMAATIPQLNEFTKGLFALAGGMSDLTAHIKAMNRHDVYGKTFAKVAEPLADGTCDGLLGAAQANGSVSARLGDSAHVVDNANDSTTEIASSLSRRAAG